MSNTTCQNPPEEAITPSVEVTLASLPTRNSIDCFAEPTFRELRSSIRRVLSRVLAEHESHEGQLRKCRAPSHLMCLYSCNLMHGREDYAMATITDEEMRVFKEASTLAIANFREYELVKIGQLAKDLRTILEASKSRLQRAR